MSDDIAVVETETAPSFDMAAASEQISADLFPESSTPSEPAEKDTTADAPATQENPAAATKTIPTIRQAPKSWAKDTHELWGKLDPKAQDYIEKREKDFLDGLDQYKNGAAYAKQLQDTIAPFDPIIRGQGLEPVTAIKALLTAQQRLTTGTLQERQAAYKELGQKLGFPQETANGNGQVTDTPLDPRVQVLQQQFEQLNQALTAQQQSALHAAREKAGQEVAAFASDPTHNLFDECSEDIVKFIQAGESLPDAYEKAVWANPVTREKQRQSWFQTETDKAKERARLEALPKKQAKGVNVHSRDTVRPPTDPLGSMDDTLRSTLKSIKERTA